MIFASFCYLFQCGTVSSHIIVHIGSRESYILEIYSCTVSIILLELEEECSRVVVWCAEEMNLAICILELVCLYNSIALCVIAVQYNLVPSVVCLQCVECQYSLLVYSDSTGSIKRSNSVTCFCFLLFCTIARIFVVCYI